MDSSNNYNVCDAVNWQLSVCGMQGEDAVALRNCISRYSYNKNGEGISEKVKGFFYRMCNAVRSLFGQSDWQVAERRLQNHIYSYIPSPFHEYARQHTHTQVHYLVGKALKFCVWENEKNLYVPLILKGFVEGQLTAFKFKAPIIGLRLLQKAVGVEGGQVRQFQKVIRGVSSGQLPYMDILSSLNSSVLSVIAREFLYKNLSV